MCSPKRIPNEIKKSRLAALEADFSKRGNMKERNYSISSITYPKEKWYPKKKVLEETNTRRNRHVTLTYSERRKSLSLAFKECVKTEE